MDGRNLGRTLVAVEHPGRACICDWRIVDGKLWTLEACVIRQVFYVQRVTVPKTLFSTLARRCRTENGRRKREENLIEHAIKEQSRVEPANHNGQHYG